MNEWMNDWLTPPENFDFLDFCKTWFFLSKNHSFHPEFQKTIFPGWICLNTTNEKKKGHFLRKTMDKPLWKNLNFLTFWTSCFYSLERRFFVLEYRKTDFSWPILAKLKIWKMANFGPKSWTNPFGKFGFS